MTLYLLLDDHRRFYRDLVPQTVRKSSCSPFPSSPLLWFCFSSSPLRSSRCSAESSSSSASLLWRSMPNPPGPACPANVSPDRKLVSVTSGEHGGDSEERDDRGDKELMERGVSDSLSAWILEEPDSAPTPEHPASPLAPAALPSGLSASLPPPPVTTSCSWMGVMELEGRKPPWPPSCRRLSSLFRRSGSASSGCSR